LVFDSALRKTDSDSDEDPDLRWRASKELEEMESGEEGTDGKLAGNGNRVGKKN
jgi:hypothetical protein